MLREFLSSINYPAVAVSGLAYWILGAIWFSALFGDAWGTELGKNGVKIKEPTAPELIAKLIRTFALNLTTAFGASFIVYAAGPLSLPGAIGIGLLAGTCFSAAAIGIAYTWEGKSIKLLLIDCGYPILGVTVCTVILSIWKKT